MLARTVTRIAPKKNARALGTLMNMFQTSKMPKVPLDEPMIAEPAKAATSVVPTDAPAITTLPNGIRVVTVDDKQAISAVGVVVESGSRFEDEMTAGSSLVLEKLALGPTANHTALAMNRALDGMGTQLQVQASRELTTYSAEVIRTDVPAMLEILGEAISSPKINSWDVNAVKKSLLEQVGEFADMVDENVVSDFAHAAAFTNTPLSLPTTPTKMIVEGINSEAVKGFFEKHYTAPSIVISCVGAEHDAVVEAADKYFGKIGGEKVTPSPAKYQGGDVRPYGYGGDGMAHVALSFESVNWTDKALAAVSVLQMMMGGGGSFSAGGPGKGMYTRLYEKVLNRYPFVQSATCSQSIYSDTGLFTLYGISDPQYANNLVAVLVEQATAMAGPVDAQELARAKNLVKSYVLMHLESRIYLQDDLGRSVISFNEVKSADTLCKEIDAVTAKDVQDVAARLLSSPLSLAAIGDVSGIPQRDVVARQITA
uniref:Mitochondrial-processing peptidase subunit alpha n=1 Tax=Lotharella globosa TaxID=91324 RepID=A0A6U3AL39_9EUKA|mmetsp:Transcript_15549/g.31519  ORF Transcript_15549/g.31519 Transcript_15549/m.31519 type:complete len:484 (+) Transcript_15549:61-1512(+)